MSAWVLMWSTIAATSKSWLRAVLTSRWFWLIPPRIEWSPSGERGLGGHLVETVGGREGDVGDAAQIGAGQGVEQIVTVGRQDATDTGVEVVSPSPT